MKENMKAIEFHVCAEYGFFKKPETSNNPMTFAIIHKPAILGIIGNVIGISRPEMKEEYPKMCDNVLVGMGLLSPLTKEIFRSTERIMVKEHFMQTTPRSKEILKDPSFSIIVATENEKYLDMLLKFTEFTNRRDAFYNVPYLGRNECPADTSIKMGLIDIEKCDMVFKTRHAISSSHIIKSKNVHLFRESIPTYQTNDWYNLPEKYVEVVFSPKCEEVECQGSCYKIGEKFVWLH